MFLGYPGMISKVLVGEYSGQTAIAIQAHNALVLLMLGKHTEGI